MAPTAEGTKIFCQALLQIDGDIRRRKGPSANQTLGIIFPQTLYDVLPLGKQMSSKTNFTDQMKKVEFGSKNNTTKSNFELLISPVWGKRIKISDISAFSSKDFGDK